MKTVSLLARVLLGLLFLVFGLNGYLAFIPMGSMPAGPAGQFVTALAQSHYMAVVSALQAITGVLLLAGQFVPLALTVLAPVIVNILLFHLFMAPQGLPLAIFVVILWLLTAHRFHSLFVGLMRQRPVV